MTDEPLQPKSNGNLGERAFVLATLTLVLLTPPVLLIFDTRVAILGIPLLHIYSFSVWLAAIAIGALLARQMVDRSQPGPDRQAGEGGD